MEAAADVTPSAGCGPQGGKGRTEAVSSALAKCPRAVVSLGPAGATSLDGPQKTCDTAPREAPVSGCKRIHSFLARVAAMGGAWSGDLFPGESCVAVGAADV